MQREDSLKRGKNNIEMILLSILCDGDFYGYQLSQLINKYSNGMISIPEGSLDPALYRLEENGCITGEKCLVGKRLERIYYHLEPAGRDYLAKLINEYNHLNTAIQNILYHKSESKEDVHNDK